MSKRQNNILSAFFASIRVQRAINSGIKPAKKDLGVLGIEDHQFDYLR